MLRAIIDGYARDAGVRRLEKQLGKIVRKTVVKLLEGAEAPIEVKKEDLEAYLGAPVFRDERKLGGIGVVTGLAWTAMGGATLSIEATRVHGANRGLKLTGQLGEVMRESAEIAYSFATSHAAEFGADPAFFENAFVHLHVPAGATPKDGPSAGITMATALLSLARGKPIRKRIAMTGELTLTGQVFPVGGIRDKGHCRAPRGHPRAHPAGGQPGRLRRGAGAYSAGMKVHFASDYDEVATLLF